MFVLDRPRISKNWEIFLPLYHRGHLSLYPGTTVYLAPVHHPDASAHHFPEIMGTTIQQSSWPTVYRISIKLRDAPGVLHSTLASVARHGGNIVNLDSTSTEQESIHEVEMVVDFASLVDSGDVAPDLSEEIEGLLLADCARYIVEEPGTGFDIRVQAHAGLRRLNSMLGKLRSSMYSTLVQAEQVQEKGKIVLGRPIIHMLRSDVGAGSSTAIEPPVAYFVSSDTIGRLFRITLVPNVEQITWCAIRHNDRPGALSAITEAIRDNDMSILSGLNRVQRHQGRSWFEVILSKKAWKNSLVPAREREQEIKEALIRANIDKDFSPTLYFDRAQADIAMRTVTNDDVSAAAWFLRRELPLSDWLDQKEKELKEHPGRMAGNPVDGLSVSPTAALSLGIKKVRTSRGRIRPKVFFSAEFTPLNKARISIARECCNTRGIDFDVVQSPQDGLVIRDEVLSRIAQATLFIGLWAPSSKEPDSKRCSPWLLWELGVANAQRIPYGILVEHGTNLMDYMPIHGERFHFPFSGDLADGFRAEFEHCLDALLRTLHIEGY
jgi:predicted amino acid-binding ACT domain protein